MSELTNESILNFQKAFVTASPRISPRVTPWFSHIIHLVVLACSIAIFARVFFSAGIFAWSAGLAYVFYDTALLIFVAWQTLPLLNLAILYPPLSSTVSNIRPTVGVIIAAYNEVEVLERTISALLAQNDPPDQILIADDGSTDGTAALLSEVYGFALLEALPDSQFTHSNVLSSVNYSQLRWLQATHGGKARTLNQAINQLNTDIVITVDADTLLAENAIAVMRNAFATEPALVAATGVLTPICSNKLIGKFLQWFQTYEYIRNFISRFAWMRVDSLLLLSGAFAGYRRKELVAVGGFDPDCLVEDYELTHRLRRYAVEHQLDWQVRVLGGAQARTSAPSTFGGFLLQRRRWFAGFLQTQYWNRDMIGNSRFGKLGMLMLPVKTLDTVQPFYGLFAFLFLIIFVASGKLTLLASVSIVIGSKILIDLVFHLWSIYLYRRWTGDRSQSKFSIAIAAAILEPFSFQLLRHTGAVMGWFYFITGRQGWGKQQRHQID